MAATSSSHPLETLQVAEKRHGFEFLPSARFPREGSMEAGRFSSPSSEAQSCVLGETAVNGHDHQDDE